MARNYKIQILRGIAIIAVILIHSCPRGDPQIFIRPFINFGVALFLFISGYLTKMNYGSWLHFFRKRILRVLIPYVIWTIIYTLLFQKPDRIAFNLVTARTSAHFYFIPVYLQFVLLTPIIGKILQSKLRWIGWLISPVSVLVFMYYNLLSHTELPDKISIVWNISCLGWFTFYYLGMFLGNHLNQRPFFKKPTIFVFTFAILLQIAEGLFWKHLGSWDSGNQLKLSALLTSSMVLLLSYLFLNNNSVQIQSHILELLGNYSFGIYLSHLMFQTFLWRIPLFSHIPYVINSAIILIVSLAFCFLTDKVCGKSASRFLGLT